MFTDKYDIPEVQRYNALLRYISPKGMNITAMGDKTLTKLFNKGWIHHPVDIYTFEITNAVKTGIVSSYVGSKIAIAIGLDHTVNLKGVMYSLHIPLIGEDNAEVLAVHYKTLVNFEREGLEQEDLPLGDEVKDSIADWLNHDYNRAFLKFLIDRQVGTCEYTDPLKDKPLTGQRWYVSLNNSVTLSLRSRLKGLGASVVRTLSNKCHAAVIVADDAILFDKCYHLGISVYTLKEAYEALNVKENTLPSSNNEWL
jgi:DNA ligase (NAD+)